MPTLKKFRHQLDVRETAAAPQTVSALVGLSMLLAIATAAGTTYLSYAGLARDTEAASLLSRAEQLRAQFRALLGTLQDAETGQRGFLLTQGDEDYLSPYAEAAVTFDVQLRAAATLASTAPDQQARLDELREVGRRKFAELEDTIALQRLGRRDEALARVMTDEGRVLMTRARDILAAAQAEEDLATAVRRAQLEEQAAGTQRIAMLGHAFLLLVIFATGGALLREFRRRKTEAWVESTVSAMSAELATAATPESVAETVVHSVAEALGAPVAAVFVREPSEAFGRLAGYAAPKNALSRQAEGAVALALAATGPVVASAAAKDYLPVTSGLGAAAPPTLLAFAARADGSVQAVVEVGLLRPARAQDMALLERAAKPIGVSLRTARHRVLENELSRKAQLHAEGLQAQHEELRVLNEELEQQRGALNDSQTRLETQQSELQQSAQRLQEVVATLERQTSALRSTRQELEQQQGNLELVGRQKSEFLAAVSHELRTPLNSSLILAKLLADNAHGNLSDEQVEYANTILHSGRELLRLIDDVLDVSKVEAGQLDVSIDSTLVEELLVGLERTFVPVGRAKGVELEVVRAPELQAALRTDSRRVAQILKNLLSNAFKFTPAGGTVRLAVTASADEVSFTVTDTGVGIAAAQLEEIFEPFRQAGPTTSRDYGGTGLGLSIARTLARRLGGDVAVRSAVGAGSAFTLRLPIHGPAPSVHESERPTDAEPQVSALSAQEAERLPDAERWVLIVEDDPVFARVLADAAAERDFAARIVGTAEEGLRLAKAGRPSAVLLDVNLPDDSGLMVLEQLKSDVKTRHIPAHVYSSDDAAEEAMELGAVGFLAKPADVAGLEASFDAIARQLDGRVRRVLLLFESADAAGQVRSLLKDNDIEIVIETNSGAALDVLSRSQVDCIVIGELELERWGSGLLQRLAALAEGGHQSFPPVIVYGGEASASHARRLLRRYARSSAVRQARGPGALVGDVALFLHQVEARLPRDSRHFVREAARMSASLRGYRVLLVEDDKRNIFALSRALEAKGLIVEVAETGAEALRAIRRASGPGHGGSFDIVLMDVMMPGMDGIEATRLIRQDVAAEHLPIIALTAKAGSEDRQLCLAAGANDFVAKPVDVDKLIALMRLWLRRRSGRDSSTR